MAYKFITPTPGWGAVDAGVKTLDARPTWAAPDSSRLALDARPGWSAPEMDLPAASLPVGTPGNDTLVKFLTFWGEPVIWRVIGHDLETMKDAEGEPLLGSTTLLADKIIAILPFDAVEPNNPDGYAKSSGNGNYMKSNIRQWLNSDDSSGNWYSPQHEYDQAPDSDHVAFGYNAYDSWSGFLNAASGSEKNILLSTKRMLMEPGSDGVTTCVDKIFLLTLNEYGLDSTDNNGIKIPYFVDDASRKASVTEQGKVHCNHPNVPNPSLDAWFYWAPGGSGISHLGDVGLVAANGVRNADGPAYLGNYGIRPACNIPSTARVSPEPDADGCYVILT